MRRGESLSCARFKAIASVAFAAALLTCCDSLVSTPIGSIQKDPRAYAGKSVTISGEVTEAQSLVLVKFFYVRDDSGEIAVVTQRPLPKKGAKIKVQGVVEEAFSILDRQFIVLVEKTDKN